MDLRPTCLRACLAAAYETMAPIAKQAGVTMQVVTPSFQNVRAQGLPAGAIAVIDDAKVQQVLRNLISNGEERVSLL